MATSSLIPHIGRIEKTTAASREALILSGDQKAFEALVKEESPRLYRMIYRIVNDEDEARSVLQETFLQAYARLKTFRGESKLTTWLYSIGLNLARAARRKASRMRVLAHEEFESLPPQFTRGEYAGSIKSWDAERAMEKAERKRLVHEAIEQLPEQHRLIVNLRDINGWATEDIASLMNISTGAVRVRLHRARQALRVLLAPYFSGSLV